MTVIPPSGVRAPTRTRSIKGAAHEMMTTAVYLFIGFEIARRINPQQVYDSMLEQYNGQLGIVKHIAAFAHWADEEIPQLDSDFPGVFHYQVTEYLGIWLYSNMNAPKDEFIAKLLELERDERAASKQMAHMYSFNYGAAPFIKSADIIKISTI